MNLEKRKQNLWTEAREAGDKLNNALADGDRILARLYALDVLDAVFSLNEIEHHIAVDRMTQPFDQFVEALKTNNKQEAVA